MFEKFKRMLALCCIAAMCAQGAVTASGEETPQSAVTAETDANAGAGSVSEEKPEPSEASAEGDGQEKTAYETEKPTESAPQETPRSESVMTEATDVTETAAPSQEPADEEESETLEPTPVATEVPTQTPVVSDTPEPTGTPSAAPTEKPGDRLSASASADRRYAFAGADRVKFTTKVSGGVAPYSVSVRISGAASVQDSVMLDAAGSCSFQCLPEKFGALKATIRVEDSRGAVSTDSVEVAVPIKERESKADWNKSVAGAVLTGDWRLDLLEVARTQIGYRESRRDYIIDENDNQQAYTRYGDWYGLNYTEWCAMFISFCLHYADIPESAFPQEARCARWKELLAYKGAYVRNDGAYVPGPGDLVFFDWNAKDTPDHVAIVEYVDEDAIYTIEGNSEKRVRQMMYDREEPTIIGFANTTLLMSRWTGVEVSGIGADVVLPEIPEAGAMGIAKGSMINVRNRASTDSAVLTQIPEKGAQVPVIDVEISDGVLWYFVEQDGFTGYVRGDLLEVDLAEPTD